MARGLRGDPGGIEGLRALIKGEHREALEYDLIQLGLRLDWLGSPLLSWRDLLVIVNQHGYRDTALRRGFLGADDSPWHLPEHLLANISDLMQQLVWLNSSDGEKGRNRPKPIERPGSRPVVDEKKFGSNSVDIVDMAAWLAKRNPHQQYSVPK